MGDLQKITFNSLFSTLPDFIFEITNDDFRMHPDFVVDQSYLSDKWSTNHIYCLPPFEEGTYLVHDLIKNPHCQLSQDKRMVFEERAKVKSVPITDITTDCFEVLNNIHHYGIKSSVFKTHVSPNKDSFWIDKVIVLLDNTNVNKHGNHAISKG